MEGGEEVITQETARAIWAAHREIEASKQLLADMKKVREENKNHQANRTTLLRDVFGREQSIELGVPSGPDSHRIFRVSPDLAESVIKGHISKMESELVEANERARIELELKQ